MPTDKRERKRQGRQARQEYLRQQRQRARLRRQIVSVVVLVALVLGISLLVTAGNDDKKKDDKPADDSSTLPTAKPVADETAVKGDTPCPPADGGAKPTYTFEKPPPMCIDPAKTYVARMTTSEGVVEVTLDTQKTPKTANNFVVLSRYHYYDGTDAGDRDFHLAYVARGGLVAGRRFAADLSLSTRGAGAGGLDLARPARLALLLPPGLRPPFLHPGGNPLGQAVGRHIAGHHREAPDIGVRAHPGELVHRREGPQHRPVFDRGVPGERGGIGQDAVVADKAIVRHVRVRHEHVAIPDRRQPPAAARAAVDVARSELARAESQLGIEVDGDSRPVTLVRAPVAGADAPRRASTMAAVSTASSPFPWTSPMITRTPAGEVTTSYRSPPIRASATAEVYETAARRWPALRGTGRSGTRWAASAMERTLASSASRRCRIEVATTPATATPATEISVV